MATLEIFRTNHGTYKIISHSNAKNPALVQLANLLRLANKGGEVKIGIFNTFGGMFENRITVYSYISQKVERMTKKQYFSWRDGRRQIRIPKSKQWIAGDDSKLIESLGEVLNEPVT